MCSKAEACEITEDNELDLVSNIDEVICLLSIKISFLELGEKLSAAVCYQQ